MTSLEVLERLAHANSMEFDPLVARESLQQAEREHPGPLGTTWAVRLTQAGKDLGLRLVPLELPARQAIAQAGTVGPLVGYAEPVPAEPTEAAEATASAEPTETTECPEEDAWLVLDARRGRRARLRRLGTGGAHRWVGVRELQRLRGGAEPALWLAAQPLAPCAELGAGPGDGHNHGHDHDHEHPHPHVGPIQRLIALVRPEWRDIRVILIFGLFVGLLSLATPLAVEALVTTVAFNRLYQQLAVLAVLLFVCLALAAAMRAVQTYVAEILQRRIFVRLVSDLSYRLPRAGAETFDHRYGPELVNRFFDVLTVQKNLASLLLDGVAIVLQTTIGLVVLAFYHPFLLGFDLVVVAAIGFTIVVLGRGAIPTSIQESRMKYAVAACLEEMALLSLAFKGSGGGEFAFARADAQAFRYIEARRAHFRILFRQIVFALGLQAVATAALLGLGGWLVLSEQLTLGQLVAAELIVAMVAASFVKLGKHVEGYYDLVAAVEKLGHLIDLPLERQNGEAPRTGGSASGGALRLIDVSYTYPTGHEPVLENINLTVAPGERVAIVGPPGSGKSTLADLLFGLRSVEAGRIELDGADLRDLRLESLREQVAVVKEPEVIEGTIAENVRMGRNLSLWDVRRALERVGLLEIASALPDGLQTRMTTTGSPLSRGQTQRLMIARAIAGRPRLLVLDQVLDGLSQQSRDRVFATVFDRAAPWTLVVMTHHPDVVRHCDQALHLDGAHAAGGFGRGPATDAHRSALSTPRDQFSPNRE